MPKIVVSTPELKPNSSWYTRYRGDGTPDAASMRTNSTATDQNAAGRGSRRVGTTTVKCGRGLGIPGYRRVGVARPGKYGGRAVVGLGMTQHDRIDLHSEFLRADLFLNMGQPTEAARILEAVVEAVVEAEPANESALELLARAYFGSAQLGRAEASLTRLVELAPANAWARRALARTLERQSRGAEAIAHHRVADALGAA